MDVLYCFVLIKIRETDFNVKTLAAQKAAFESNNAAFHLSFDFDLLQGENR